MLAEIIAEHGTEVEKVLAVHIGANYKVTKVTPDAPERFTNGSTFLMNVMLSAAEASLPQQ
ncbi:hypothetical protein GCM10027594_17140 [Hymenobacter agri]